MEELEGFLMQEDRDILQEFWPPSLHISSNDTSLNLDQIWGMQFPDAAGFESELCSLMREDEFVTPSCFTSNKEENNGLLEQYIQPEQQREQEQEQERHREPAVQPLRPLDEEEEEEEESNDKSRMDSKNLVSERNRRKRLNQQLFTLRSLVPNITKMDKRSILVDALSYLQSITQQIEMEMKKKSLSSDSTASSSNSSLVQEDAQPVVTTLYERQCAALPLLSLVEADVLDEERFLLRIYCNKAVGALGQVDRIIEMLGLEITCISMDEFDQDTMQTKAFLRVKKKGIVTQEKLLNRVRLNAKQLGLLLSPDE